MVPRLLTTVSAPAEVLSQVSAGVHVTVTLNGVPVAVISPVRALRRGWMSRRDLVVLLARDQADPGLRDDLAALGEPSTDDLGPLR